MNYEQNKKREEKRRKTQREYTEWIHYVYRRVIEYMAKMHPETLETLETGAPNEETIIDILLKDLGY